MTTPGEQFRASNVNCSRCPELCASRRTICDGAGPDFALLMCVAEAPGEWEDKNGIPFVGESGALLRGTLSEYGIHNSQLYVTNMVRCRPPDNRDPTRDEIENCMAWLTEEFERVQPRAVLLLGRIARLHAMRAWQEAGSPGRVFVAEHPASIMRSPRNKPAWKAALAEAVEYALNISRREPVNTVTPAGWCEGIPAWDSPWLAVDTETDDLEEGYGKRLVSVQYSDGDNVLFMDRRVASSPLPRAGHVYAHNIKYDAPLIGLDLSDLSAWDDTGLMAYVLRYPRVGLKEIGPALTGIEMEPISAILKYREQTRTLLKSKCRPCKGSGCDECEHTGHPVRHKERWAKRSFSEALHMEPARCREYANKDPLVTSRVARALHTELQFHPKLYRYYHMVEKPCVPVVMEMERNGVHINADALTPLADQLDADIKEAVETLRLHIPGDYNPRSNDQLAQALIEHGIELREQTATGKWQLDEATILKSAGVDSRDELEEQMFGSWQWAVLEMRRLEKLRNTYVTKLLGIRDEMGRVHTTFNQMVAGTNRLSSSNPINLQNIPIRGKIRKAIRSAFDVPPGKVLVKADFSQLEVRIYAHYTRHPILASAYPWDAPARDVHQGVADALGIPRWRAKNTLFGAIYGADAPKLAATAGVQSDQASSFLSRLRQEMDCLVKWPRHIAALLTRHGYIETWLGWRNYYPEFWSPLRKDQRAALREAANLPIQGTASGIVKLTMIRARELCARFDALALLQVHDEMVYEVPAGAVPEFAVALAALGHQVGRDVGLTIPLEFSVETGPNWGECTPFAG